MEKVLDYLNKEIKRRKRYKEKHFIKGEETENWTMFDLTTNQFIKAIYMLT